MSVFAAATGVGSWPGSSPAQAAEVIVGELHSLAHLVELPARGVGADTIGRAGALLVDIGIDTTPRGYRIVAGHSSAGRRAVSLLDECVATVGGELMLHSCAPDLPWKMLQRSTIRAISVDVSTLAAADLDGVGEFVESGRTVLLGVVPTTAPTRRPSVEEIATSAVSVTDRLGFARSVLRDRIGITPACGLAGASAQWARTAIELAQRTADAFVEDPDAI